MDVLIFILTSVGFGLYSSYFLYRQIYFGVVRHSGDIKRHILVFSLSAFILWLVGYFLSTAIVKTFDQYLAWISIPILIFLGIRMFVQARKTNELNWTFDSNTLKTMFFMSMLVNFDAFFLGFAMGLILKYSLLFPVIFLLLLLIFLILLSFMARRETATLAVWLLAAMGAVLIGFNSIIVLYMLFF